MTQAKRLIEEFNEGMESWNGRTRFGIAKVLRHIAATCGDSESWYAIPASTLVNLASELEAPSLLERALAGDAKAAREFLCEAGFTDRNGNLLPQYQPIDQHEQKTTSSS